MADIDVFEGVGAVIVEATVAGQNSFDFDFLAYTADTVLVVFRNQQVGEVPLELGSDYLVSGLGQEAGGSIILSGLYAGVSLIGDKVLIYRETPVRRLFDYQNAGDFRADVVNRELDTMIMIDQEARRDINRSYRSPIGVDPLELTITPGADGTVPLWDGSNLVPGPTADEIENANDAALRAQEYAAMLSADKIKFSTVAALEADVLLAYVAGPGAVVVGEGDHIEAERFPFRVAASDAVGRIVETDNGVKLFTIPTVHRRLTARQFGCQESHLDDADRLIDAVGEAGTLGVPLLIDGNFKSGAQINAVADTVIEFVPGIDASITMVEDHQIGINSEGFRLELHNPRVIDIVPVASRVIDDGNRAIRANGGPGLFIFGDAYYEGFYTAAHALACAQFIAPGTHMVKNALGAAAQEGYGLNTSALRSIIGNVIGDNTDLPLGGENGRHLVYFNGAGRWCFIESMTARNYYYNPLNIAPNGADTAGLFWLKKFYFENVNRAPLGLASQAGGVIGCAPNNALPQVALRIDGGVINGYDGLVLSNYMGGFDHSIIRGISAYNRFGVVTHANMHGINVTDMDFLTVEDLFVKDVGLATNSIVFVRGASKSPTIKNVRTEATIGNSIARIAAAVTGQVTISGLEGDITHLRDDGSTAGYNLQAKDAYTTVDNGTPFIGGLKNIRTIRATNLDISDFLGGVDGQELVIFAQTGNTRIIHDAALIVTKTAATVTLATRGYMGFKRLGSRWIQIW